MSQQNKIHRIFLKNIILKNMPNFATYETVMVREDETLNGENENIRGLPASGNDIITSVSIVDSGKSYLNGENVDLYLQGGLSNVVISSGGSGYQNNELVISASSIALTKN